MDPQTSAGSLERLRIRLVLVALLAALLAGTTLAAGGSSVPRPHIVWKPIVFGSKRKAETEAPPVPRHGRGS